MEFVFPNGAATTEAPVPAEQAAAAIREQDRLMPIANVTRIMRRVLPPHAKISDDAKELIQECVSEFISFVTGEANERCHGEHRKTVTAEDVVAAMERLGFDDYALPLGVYLQRMRDHETADRAAPRAPRAPPATALHGGQVQQAVYATPPAAAAQGCAAANGQCDAYSAAMPAPSRAPPHAYSVAIPAAGTAPDVGGQYESVAEAPHYGASSADEATSWDDAPAPQMGIGSQL